MEDISSIAKSTNIKEISIDNNPISLAGDCVSFLVSYLPNLTILNSMQITEQVRKAAMAWRRNKETTNAAFLDLTSDVCLHVRREEVISNARTNWELLRSQTKCLNKTSDLIGKYNGDISDFVLKSEKKMPALTIEKKMKRTSSQESQNTSSSNSSEFFRLPPILVPIINKMEQKNNLSTINAKENNDSFTSISPNIDSSTSSLISSDSEESGEKQLEKNDEETHSLQKIVSETNSELSAQTNNSGSSGNSSGAPGKLRKNVRNIRSAVNAKSGHGKLVQTRAVTAKPKKQQISPIIPLVNKDREQGK